MPLNTPPILWFVSCSPELTSMIGLLCRLFSVCLRIHICTCRKYVSLFCLYINIYLYLYILFCIFFHLMCTYDSQVSQTGHFQFVYIFFLLYSIYPLLVFSNSIRDTTHHVVYDKGLEVIYSTVLLLLCSCFGRITPAPDNTIFTQVQ